VGFAKNLTDRFAIGFNAKYIREKVWNSSATGFALDVGTVYRTPFNDLLIGAAISNFGTPMSLSGRDLQFNHDPNNNLDTGPNNIPADYSTDSFDLPLTFRLGLAMDVYNSRYFRATASLDAVHPNDNSEYINSGLELAYDELFFVRVGYKSLFKNNSEEGLTLGAGIKYFFVDNLGVYLNYGYADYGRLEKVQFVDVGLIF
jgi:opacity protein-like surface antigen